MTRRVVVLLLNIILVLSLIGIFLNGCHRVPLALVLLFGVCGILLAVLEFTTRKGGRIGRRIDG